MSEGGGRLLTKQPALRRLRHLCSACHSPGARPWTPPACGDLGRRPTLPNPHGAFSPRKGGVAHPFHPHSQGRRSPLPLHPLAACPSGTKEGTSLSGHSKPRTTRRLSLHPLRRLRRKIRQSFRNRSRGICSTITMLRVDANPFNKRRLRHDFGSHKNA